MNLLFAFDQNYVKQFLCTFRSVLYHHSKNISLTIFILYLDTTKDNQKNVIQLQTDLENLRKIKSFDDNIILFDHQRVTNFPIKVNDHVSLATYIRLFITQYLPDNVDKIIYLDSDLIIRTSLHVLWEKDLKDNYLAAVSQGRKNPEQFYRHYYNFKGFTRDKFIIFNAGVLVINLKLWRKDKLLDKFIPFIKDNHKHLRFHDQDVLNCLCMDKWLKLNWKWNYYLNIKHSPDQRINDSKIIHYNSSDKPWNSDYTNDAKKYWTKYWKEYPSEKK